MKIYIIGPATNCHPDTVEMYEQAYTEMRRRGHTVINIMYESGWHNQPTQQNAGFRLSSLLTCQAVVVLPGWQGDEIAQLEMAAAVVCGMQVLFQKQAVKPHKISFFIL